MKFGIIGAMDEEVNSLKESMENRRSMNIASMEFVEGVVKGREAVIVRSGIGKVNAAICTQILADIFSVNAIINTGIAGGLDNSIEIGDIVLSTDALQHDVEAIAFGYDAGVIPRMETSIFKADERLRNAAKEICKKINPKIGVHMGRVVSGDQFISDAAKKEWIHTTFMGACTEMEGAAIAHTAYLNNIPFLIIRAISDKADNSASMDYEQFERKAIKHAVRLVKGLLEYNFCE